ncbi:O-antigen translocase [Paenisporosarcina sp. TG20]|uniref:O-antigen translocase n=1 Tax=Paenisporosarcina sp. TG20 TaxID=1211706 RepID=UPI0002E95A99|nr:O-antigen translocase [Paenisporosarcina sp. TG20]
MNLIKTIMLSGVSTIIKLLSWLVINKIIAVYIGPSGIALIGQFQNFLNIVITFGNGAINTGITKYVAEYGQEETKKKEVISAALIIALIFSLIIGLITFIGSSNFSLWIFKTSEYHLIIKLLAITLILISINTTLLSIINGLKEIKLFIGINIVNSLLSLIITSFLTVMYGIFGALLSLVIVQSIICFITVPLVWRKIDFTRIYITDIGKSHYRKLLTFSLMTIVSVISVSVTQIIIRNYVIKHLSIEQAGYWQSVWLVSSMYLMIFTTAFSTYYLPRLSELKKHEDLRKEILVGYKIILPLILISSFSIYLLKDFIIENLFTLEFSAMRSLFAFQLIGDFLKMSSFSLAFLMISKAMTKTFIITEIIFSISFYLLTIFFVKINGLEGVTHAYAVNYFFYLLTMVLLFKHIIFIKKNKSGEFD